MSKRKEQTDQRFDKASVPLDRIMGQAAYIKGSEGTQFIAETQEPQKTPRAPAPANPDDLSLESKKPGDIADKQILIRVTDEERERWKQAATIEGTDLSKFIRNHINDKVKGLLECPHPPDRQKVYPWSRFCLVCGKRLQ